MRKVVVVMITLVMLFSISYAQDAPTKTKMIGINPLGLLLNLYSGHYAMITNGGATELNFPFLYWSPLDELTIMGIGAKYRIYKEGNGKGIFYGGGLEAMSISWDYETLDENWDMTTETITGVTFTPGGEAGYRWSWDNGFTLAPSIGAGYTLGTIEASDGTEADFGSSGISWSLGIGFAYMF